MKLLFNGILTTALLLTFSAASHASFIKTDWKTTGDQAAVLDSQTGIEWLRTDLTNKKSINMVSAELSTTYSGWRFPTNAEVESYISRIWAGVSMEISSVTARSGGYRTGANKWIGLMSNGYKTLAHHTALYTDEDGVVRFLGAYANEGGSYTISYGLEYPTAYNNDTIATSHYRSGVLLVSDGGTTLSSINNPNLNINNPNAPINNSTTPTDVAFVSPFSFAVAGLGMMLAGGLRRRKAALVQTAS